MKEQNQRQIHNQTELDERRMRQKKLVRKRKIVLSVMLLTSFLLGCVCGRYFPEIKLGKTEEVLASAQDNAGAALHMGMTAMLRSADAVRQHWRWQ